MSMISRRLGRILAALVVVAGLFWASAAASTTALKFDLQSLVVNSNQIVVADVTEMRSLRKQGRIYTDTTLEVRETWKGEATEEVTVRLPGGRIGDTVTRVHGMPGFQTGERVVAFLKERYDDDDSKRFSVTGLRQGKFHIALGPDTTTEFVVPRLHDLRLLAPKDGSFDPQQLEDIQNRGGKDESAGKIPQGMENLEVAAPAPIHQKVLSLDDFRDRVQSRLKANTSSNSSTGGQQ
jgi:hypothetical protein